MSEPDQDSTTTQPLEPIKPESTVPVEPADTPLQRLVQAAPFSPRTKWVIGLIITIVGSTAYPVAAGVSTYADKKAMRDTATAKQEADALVSKRQMQADLLKRVIAVAEKATLKDPTSIFQLGLIAQMVENNRDTFGITLQDAARTMRRMFESLAPVAGLRRRLAESDWLLRWLKQRRDRSVQQQKKLQEHITELQRTLTKEKFPWRRQRLQIALQDHQNHLQQRQTEQLFYDQQLKREESIHRFFADALQRQEDMLTRRLQQTTLLRKRLQERTQRFSYLVTALKLQAKVPRATATELRTIMVEVESDNESAQQTIVRLNAELKSERDAHDATKRALQRVRVSLQQCQINQFIPIPQLVCPAGTAQPRKAAKAARAVEPARPLGMF